MLKRLALAAAILLHIGALAQISQAEILWPDCLPCPEDKEGGQ